MTIWSVPKDYWQSLKMAQDSVWFIEAPESFKRFEVFELPGLAMSQETDVLERSPIPST